MIDISLPLDSGLITYPGDARLETYDYKTHEFALKFDDYLIVGDSAYGIQSKLKFYPSGIWPEVLIE